MRYNEVVDEIIKLIQENKNFAESGIHIEQSLDECSVDDILGHLDYGGMIPEIFKHDSTEEKIFAKYCDALLARSLNELGLDARVLKERADAADVSAECDDHYSLVGDAKAFRLSRTAKNAKDFKIEALHKWKKGVDYACLIGPIYHFLKAKSQVYSQATRFNVALLSYTHLAFLIRNKNFKCEDLEELWKVSVSVDESEGAVEYGAAVETVILKLTGKSSADWARAAADTQDRLAEQIKEQVDFWEKEKRQYATIAHDTAVKLLIDALKIDKKIATIQRLGKIKKRTIKKAAAKKQAVARKLNLD